MRRLSAGALLALVALFGQPARGANLRVVTFNTAMGIVTGVRAPALRRMLLEDPRLRGADVFSLQEVCLNDRTQLALYLEVMQRARGAQYHYSDYASDHLGQPCDKGQAIVSALPISNAGTLHLPTVGADRVAVWVDLAVDGPGYERMRVYSLHLSNRRSRDYVPTAERADQAGPIIEDALAFMSDHPGAPVVVAGDFNTLSALTDPWRREPVIRRFYEYFQASQTSFVPTFLLPYQLDWIFYANLTVSSSRVVRGLFSDHYPLTADFNF